MKKLKEKEKDSQAYKTKQKSLYFGMFFSVCAPLYLFYW